MRFTFTLLLACCALPAQTLQVNFIKKEIVEERLRQFEGDNKKREAKLKGMFEEEGCQGDRLTEQPVKQARNPNVICTLPGTTDQIIVVGAHFDRVDNSKGVADNWSGASLLPSLFSSLKDKAPRHTFVFIGFTDEEKGLVGSKFYVSKLTKEQKALVRSMINMDTLGLGPAVVWFNRSDPELVKLLDRAGDALKLPVNRVNVENIGSTDSESFRDAKIPSLTVHSITQATWSILHTSSDRLDAIKLDDYYDTYRLLATYLLLLDTKLE